MTADYAHLNDYILTSPLGHLYSRDTIHSGETKFGPRKMFNQSLYLLPLFSGPETRF